jgi:hypothetical protein
MNNQNLSSNNSNKHAWHTPNVYVLNGSVTGKPFQFPIDGTKQPSAIEHPDSGDPYGFPHGPDEVIGPS